MGNLQHNKLLDLIVKNMKKDTGKIKKYIAFSLVELMISLITISCIAAAFTPIITKRLSKNATAVKSGNNLISDCANSKYGVPGGDMCSLCYPGECVVCTRKCTSSQYLNQKTCICENCSTLNVGTGDAAGKCSRCNEDGCYGCQTGFWFNATTKKCIKCKEDKDANGLRIYCCPEGSTSEMLCEHSYTQDHGSN